jgi:hypothetical protein
MALALLPLALVCDVLDGSQSSSSSVNAFA